MDDLYQFYEEVKQALNYTLTIVYESKEE